MSDIAQEIGKEVFEALDREFAADPKDGITVHTDDWRTVVNYLTARTQAPASGEVEPVRLIDWTPEQPANEQIAYNHVLAETLFGKFEITWKGWKEDGAPTVDETPWGDYFGAYSTVDEAKAACEAEYARRLRQSGVQVVQATASGEVEPAYQPDKKEQEAFRKALIRSADVVHPPAKVPEGWDMKSGYGRWEVVQPNGRPVSVPVELCEFFSKVFGEGK